MTKENRSDCYQQVLDDLEQASRQYAATKFETREHQDDRARAIVEVSRLGVPRSAVAKLAGLTRGRVQEHREPPAAAGRAGEDWGDPVPPRLVEAAIATRPTPPAARRHAHHTTRRPLVRRGAGVAVPLGR